MTKGVAQGVCTHDPNTHTHTHTHTQVAGMVEGGEVTSPSLRVARVDWNRKSYVSLRDGRLASIVLWCVPMVFLVCFLVCFLCVPDVILWCFESSYSLFPHAERGCENR